LSKHQIASDYDRSQLISIYSSRGLIVKGFEKEDCTTLVINGKSLFRRQRKSLSPELILEAFASFFWGNLWLACLLVIKHSVSLSIVM
jgi:hypothetical protein